jgi:hypothetical protein
MRAMKFMNNRGHTGITNQAKATRTFNGVDEKRKLDGNYINHITHKLNPDTNVNGEEVAVHQSNPSFQRNHHHHHHPHQNNHNINENDQNDQGDQNHQIHHCKTDVGNDHRTNTNTDIMISCASWDRLKQYMAADFEPSQTESVLDISYSEQTYLWNCVLVKKAPEKGNHNDIDGVDPNLRVCGAVIHPNLHVCGAGCHCCQEVRNLILNHNYIT